MTYSELFHTLSLLCQGLLYPSESDFPLEAFVLENPSENLVLDVENALGIAPNSPRKHEFIEDFFAPLIEEQNWFGQEERTAAAKFAGLQDFFRNRLSHSTFYQFGETELMLVVVGKTPDGAAIGIQTKAYQT